MSKNIITRLGLTQEEDEICEEFENIFRGKRIEGSEALKILYCRMHDIYRSKNLFSNCTVSMWGNSNMLLIQRPISA